MVLLGAWRFHMSEVPLDPSPRETFHQGLALSALPSLEALHDTELLHGRCPHS